MTVRKPSIKTRILSGYLGLLAIAFLAVFVVFNISVSQYIETNAENEIRMSAQFLLKYDMKEPTMREGTLEKERANKPPNPIGAEAHFFVWDGDDDMVQTRLADYEAEEEIAEKLDPSKDIGQVRTVVTSTGTYVAEALATDVPDKYIVLYVNVTDMKNFAQSINTFLLITLMCIGAAAVAFSFGIASSLVRPFRQLAGFAKKLGENDFEQSELQFEDREPAELLAVMNRTAEKLKAYDSDQKTFFQNVSHELKTPLMTIRCNAEGVVFHVMDAEKSAHTIMRETDRLGEMIDDVLYISRMDTITESEVREDCDIREILSNCVESQRAAADKRGIQVICDFSPEPVMRSVSEKSLMRAMSNLVSNAIRYAKNRVVLTCSADAGLARVSVWNDGPEISGKDLPRIFERFYKGAGGQSGIGLSIVKSVVEKMGGTIGVETGPDGTRFTTEF